VKRLAAVALVAAALAACSDDGGGWTTDDGSSESSPFRVDAPSGLEVLNAGRGGGYPAWGDDSLGNTGGFTVLGRTAEATDIDDLAIVELTGFESYQGGLHQASNFYYTSRFEPRTVADRPAQCAGEPVGEPDATYAELIVVWGDDLAVATRAAGVDCDDLADLAADVLVPGGDPPTGPPSVEGGGGWEPIGEASADLALALETFANDDHLDGPASAHVVAFAPPGATDDALTVLTLPGDAGDVDAALGYPRASNGEPAEVARTTVDGREAVWLRLEQYTRRGVLVTTTSWGDLLVVIATPVGPEGPILDRSILEAVAASATQVTDGEWAEVVAA
jgi:hypothetical protein